MKIDFLNDLRNLIKSNLKLMGYSLPQNQELPPLMLYYSNITKRLIAPQKRTVKISKEICKDDLKLKKVDILKTKIENGDDINAFQSNKIKNNPMYQDKLFNDWEIHHIHFAKEKTKELLFVFFDQKNAYLIDIMPHENPELGIITWANSNLIQILHNNWPDLLIPYKMNSVTECGITDKNRQTLRNKNANAFIQMLDGTIYMPIGGGLVTSGHSISDITDIPHQNIKFFYLKKLRSNLN